jgi:hypothetical protein
MPKKKDEPSKDAGKAKPQNTGKGKHEELDVNKEISERVRGGRRMISGG